MNEGMPNNIESAERMPSKEEIRSVFEQVTGGKEFTETLLREGANGVEVYEIEVIDEDGNKLEYNYQPAMYDYRDESLPASARYAASIHVTKYDGDMPISGECVANYVNGSWEFTS